MKFKEFLNEAKDKDVEKDSPEYKAYFDKMLKKYKVEDPSELDTETKKKFFDEVDAGWKADNEMSETDENTEDLTEASGEGLYKISYDSVMGLEIKSKDGKQTIWLKGMSSKEDKVLADVGSKLKSIDLDGSYNIRM